MSEATITLYVNKDNNELLVTERDALNLFKDELDEVHESTELLGMTFYPSMILASDPIAERESFLNWLDADYYCYESVPFSVWYNMVGHGVEGETLSILVFVDNDETKYQFESC